MILSFHELKMLHLPETLNFQAASKLKIWCRYLLAVVRNASSLLFMLGCSRSSDTALKISLISLKLHFQAGFTFMSMKWLEERNV
jgi:hypothetical protein